MEEILCERCNVPMIRIFYGFPTPAVREMADAGILALAGCMSMTNRNMPTHYCKECLYSYPDFT